MPPDMPMCRPCRDLGHECPATRRINEEDWCGPCADGKTCYHEKAIVKAIPCEDEKEARDLMKTLSQTMNGILSGKVSPAQANAVCNTANTVLKIVATVRRFRDL